MRRDFHAQFGEDRILSKIFSTRSTGVCVEVGANDGINDSMTLYFERMGWTCVLVEPNPSLCEAIRRDRRALLFECAASATSGATILNVAEGADRAHGVSSIGDSTVARERIERYGFTSRPIEVATRRLDDILEDAGVQAPLDFVTIDVEGHELDVLRGFSLALWRPSVVILEDNSQFLDRRVRHHMRESGYLPIRRTGVNDWYAHRDDKSLTKLTSIALWHGKALGARLRAAVRALPGARTLVRWIRSAW
jgi:FkbM family methyltransferase